MSPDQKTTQKSEFFVAALFPWRSQYCIVRHELLRELSRQAFFTIWYFWLRKNSKKHSERTRTQKSNKKLASLFWECWFDLLGSKSRNQARQKMFTFVSFRKSDCAQEGNLETKTTLHEDFCAQNAGNIALESPRHLLDIFSRLSAGFARTKPHFCTNICNFFDHFISCSYSSFKR